MSLSAVYFQSVRSRIIAKKIVFYTVVRIYMKHNMVDVLVNVFLFFYHDIYNGILYTENDKNKVKIKCLQINNGVVARKT